MAIAVSNKSNFVQNPMLEGLNPAVISDLAERDIPDFNDKTKTVRKIVARFVNEAGQEASRFYTPSLHEKSTLRKDLISIGAIKANAIPDQIDDLEKLLVGKQCVVVIAEGVNGKGETIAKITAVTKPMPNQKVPMPAKKAAAAPPATKASTRRASTPPPPVADGTEITDDDLPDFGQ